MRAGRTQTPRPRSPSPAHVLTAGGRTLGRLEAGQVLESTIERIVPGGAGLAHAAGGTLFVELSAPGDRLRVSVSRVQGKVGFASIEEILEPGPDRVAPPHPAFVRCGGGDFQHLTYEAQLAAKVGIVRDCLRRIGGITWTDEIPIEPAPRPWGYRAVAEWRHDPEAGTLGYFGRDSHRVCDLEEDPGVVPELAETFTQLRRRLAVGALPANVKEFRAVAGDVAVAIAPSLPGVGEGEVERAVAGERYRFGADAFFQVNPDLLGPLLREALRHADPSAVPDGMAVDLYCGVGLFTLPLARRFPFVVGVEAHAPSAAWAARNLADAGLANARVVETGVDAWLARRASGHGPVGFVLLDPPRAGADPKTLDGLARLHAPRVAYVSCDPATLARDLKHLAGRGYRPTALAALDLFPQTHHVEVVAHLERTEDRG